MTFDRQLDVPCGRFSRIPYFCRLRLFWCSDHNEQLAYRGRRILGWASFWTQSRGIRFTLSPLITLLGWRALRNGTQRLINALTVHLN